MKKILSLLWVAFLTCSLYSQDVKTIALSKPDLNRGTTVMKAFSMRASASAFDSADLNMKDVSDLLWAANGINRQETGKRTAPSAINGQDIDVYVCMRKGIYLYDAAKNVLEPVATGDFRKLVAGGQENFANAPLFCILVSDVSRFRFGEDAERMVWAAEDAGIVSENIGIFCAGMDLLTRPRATMDIPKLKEIMKLKDTQHMMLNNPVSYKIK